MTTESRERTPAAVDYRITSGASAWTVSSSAAARAFIGSSEACEIRVEDRLVSRRHASLRVTPDGLELEDLGSTNGTRVGDVRVARAFLTGGERIVVGDTELRVHVCASQVRDREPAPHAIRFGKVLGASAAMRRLYPVCERIARSDVPVLIEGETGCGKEVLAESIHGKSRRADAGGPFVVFDCTTVNANMLEATLFGHEKGAFTGAAQARPGVFELAHGGTLFIDEIGDLDVTLQAKLLRAIQSGRVQRIGGTKWIQVDARIISATRRDLEREIQHGRFRDDLFYRLVVARVELPPLRERRQDVPLLARAFWKDLGGDDRAFPTELLAGLDDHAWPGNVRELHNLVARRLALGDRDAPPTLVRTPPAGGDGDDVIARVIAEKHRFARARERVLMEFERRYLEWALDEHGGNVTKAAEACGIGRRYFYVLRGKTQRP